MSARMAAKHKALRAVANEPAELREPDTLPAEAIPANDPVSLAPLPQSALSWAILWAQFSAVAMANMVLMSSLAMDTIAASRRPVDADPESGA